jgi:hypothetical protein
MVLKKMGEHEESVKRIKTLTDGDTAELQPFHARMTSLNEKSVERVTLDR